MRPFYASLTQTTDLAPNPRHVTFPAGSLNDAAERLQFYTRGAALGNVKIEIISLAAYKTRGTTYEDLL